MRKMDPITVVNKGVIPTGPYKSTSDRCPKHYYSAEESLVTNMRRR